MSSAEIIALLCVLCLVPLWAAGSIIMFALGTVRCGRLMDPYYQDGGGSDGNRGHCPFGPHSPSDDGGAREPQHERPGPQEADWWPDFERDLGRYVEVQESCASGRDETAPERGTGASGTRTLA